MANQKLEEILRKIREIEELPTYEEAVELFRICGSTSIVDLAFSSQSIPHSLFQVWNVEFVDALAEEIKRLDGGKVLEMGAANGKLAYHLRLRGIPVIATDDYSMHMLRNEALVNKMTHIEALEIHNPRVVIASWVRDIADDVMWHPSVDSLILIYSSCCHVPDYRLTPLTPQRRQFQEATMENVRRYGVCAGDFYPNGMNHSVVLHLRRIGTEPNYSKATNTSLPSTFTW